MACRTWKHRSRSPAGVVLRHLHLRTQHRSLFAIGSAAVAAAAAPLQLLLLPWLLLRCEMVSA